MALRLRTHGTKVLASLALVAAAAGVAGLGTYGSFTSTTSASEDVATTKVVLAMTQHATRGLNLAATGLVPGDTVQRAVTLTRGTDSDSFGSVRLSTTAETTNLLTTDNTHGLQLKVDTCPAAWAKAATSNELTCTGTTTTVVASRTVLGTGLDLGGVTTGLNGAGKAAHLRVTLTLPETAGNAFQGLANTVNFSFDATQRTADYR